MLQSRRVALIALIVAFAALSGLLWWYRAQADEAGLLARSQGQWQALRLSHYRYTFEQQCFCPPETRRPVVVEVQDGVVRAVVFADDQTPVADAAYGSYLTIDGLFVVVAKAIAYQGSRTAISYDPQRGYPAYAAIDYAPNATDDEYSFQVRDVEVLP
jgi:hypothetical protein